MLHERVVCWRDIIRQALLEQPGILHELQMMRYVLLSAIWPRLGILVLYARYARHYLDAC
jgi:hypothetical protein